MPGPATEKYKCPVKNCKTEPRGDDVSKHFQNSANLKALDRAVANQSNLRKTLLSAPGKVVEKSEEFLSTLLLLASDKEKEHTKYLFHHGNSSTDLPDMNSINFKCQQEKEKAKKRPLPIFFQPKKAKLDQSDTAATAIEQNEEVSEIETEFETADLVTPLVAPPTVATPTTPTGEKPTSETPTIETPTVETSKIETPEVEISAEKEIAKKFSIEESTLKLAVQEALLYPAFVEQFAEKLEQARKTLKKNELDEPKTFWIEDDNFWICNACLCLSKTAPAPLLAGKSGNFGFVSKKGKPAQITQNKARHCGLKLHKWCADEFERKEEKKNQR